MKNKKTNNNTLHIYAVQEIVKINNMFKNHVGGVLNCISIENTDLKYSKKELYIHDSDIGYSDLNTVAFVTIDTEEKKQLQWYELKNYVPYDFKNWKLRNEAIEYK